MNADDKCEARCDGYNMENRLVKDDKLSCKCVSGYIPYLKEQTLVKDGEFMQNYGCELDCSSFEFTMMTKTSDDATTHTDESHHPVNFCECIHGHKWNGDTKICDLNCEVYSEMEEKDGKCECIEGFWYNTLTEKCWKTCEAD